MSGGTWFFYGPLLLKRPLPAESDAHLNIPNYAVVQDDPETRSLSSDDNEDSVREEKNLAAAEVKQLSHKELKAEGDRRLRIKLMQKRGPIGWAMRTLNDNPLGPGQVYEVQNLKIIAKRIPAQVVSGLLYGVYYDIHAAQTGIADTPDGERMKRVYQHATMYSNEVEHTYSFVQILTACTASFAHGANDIGNSVGPWAVIYSTWSTGQAAKEKAEVPVWQLAVLALTISLGLATYGYNIMKGQFFDARNDEANPVAVMGNKITYHSPSRGCSMEMGAAITVLTFSQYSLPVSTSMCITGATVGVGLCNGTFKAVNWQRVGLLFLSWVMTIPIAATLGGVLMGIILNAPHFCLMGCFALFDSASNCS